MKVELLKGVAALIAAVLATLPAHAADGWTDNYEAALAQAKAEKKLVFADFCGSDWSAQCKKQAAEVFAKQEFKDYAAKHLVLLQLDYPKTKELGKTVKDQNSELRSKLAVRSIPTTVVLDADGNVLGRWAGYSSGGSARIIAKLEAFKE